jgi:subtilisin
VRRFLCAWVVALLAVGAAPDVDAAPLPADRYIVVLKDSVAAPGSVAAEHGRRYGVRVTHVYRSAIRGYAGTIPGSALARLRADDRVASLTLDRPFQADAQAKPTGIRRTGATISSTRSGDGVGSVNVAVAVIDSGIDVDHPDLNVVSGMNCSTGNSFDDGNGHGSHVAGTIGARDNGIGVVGIAPGAALWSVRVLDDRGSGTSSTVLCGIDFVDSRSPAHGGPIRVANMSIGAEGTDDGSCGSVDDDAIHDAICRTAADGVLFVAAAGNANANLANQIPAAYDEVLTVTAVADFDGKSGGFGPPTCRSDVDDTVADFSNFTVVGGGDEPHTIAGPGVCIKSAWKDGGYRKISGTSMATPHVTGMAALCIASGGCEGLTPGQIAQKLRTDAAARPLSYGFVGDPARPIAGPGGTTRYYGHLAYAGGY